MSEKDLPEDIQKYILEYLDYKCIMCKQKLSFFKKYKTINEFHFCKSECIQFFYIYPF